MDEPRLLPHLAAACRVLLGDEDIKNIPPALRARIACAANVGQPTVDRFLKGERVPRNRELDDIVAAVAKTAELGDWLDPWRLAIERAEGANVKWKRFLSGDLPIAPEPPDDGSGEPGGERPL